VGTTQESTSDVGEPGGSPSLTGTDSSASAPPRPGRFLPLLPTRMRSQLRPKLWQEIVFIALSYYLYSLIRNAVPKHERNALTHGRQILYAEDHLRLSFERSVNRFFDQVHWGGWHYLANAADYYYALMHFVVVISVLVWVYVKRPLNYRSARTVLYATNAIAALGFWFYPLAPPRLLPNHDFIDTVVKYHTWGSWGSGGISKVSNQFAAMPSLHIGWSLWAGITLFMLSGRWWIRALGLAYPVVTFFVIIGTANHYTLDAAGGVVALAGGFVIQRLLTGRHVYRSGAEDIPEHLHRHTATANSLHPDLRAP
jgi:PAP2 superfamily